LTIKVLSEHLFEQRTSAAKFKLKYGIAMGKQLKIRAIADDFTQVFCYVLPAV